MKQLVEDAAEAEVFQWYPDEDTYHPLTLITCYRSHYIHFLKNVIKICPVILLTNRQQAVHGSRVSALTLMIVRRKTVISAGELIVPLIHLLGDITLEMFPFSRIKIFNRVC